MQAKYEYIINSSSPMSKNIRANISWSYRFPDTQGLRPDDCFAPHSRSTTRPHRIREDIDFVSLVNSLVLDGVQLDITSCLKVISMIRYFS